MPCVRVQQPCAWPPLRAHCDAQYGHALASVNVWLPLTRASAAGTATLQLERWPPGTKRFAPLELRLGELAVFWGAYLAHFTVANTTCVTRVSLDFRVVPRGREGEHYREGAYYALARRRPAGGAAPTYDKVRGGTPSHQHGLPWCSAAAAAPSPQPPPPPP